MESSLRIHIPRQKCNTCHNCSGPSIDLTPLPNDTELLRTNTIPSTTRIDPQTFSKAANDLSRVDDEIGNLRSILTSLLRRRMELQKFVDQRSSLLAPIRRLPEDVLGHIFLLCQRSWPDDKGAVTICNPATFVRVITRVCSFWRHTALNYHLLWSHVNVDFHVKRGRNITDVLQMMGPFLRECIQRSGQAPLTLRFSRTCTPKIFPSVVVEELARCAWRWEDIHIGLQLLKKVQKKYTSSSSPCSPFLKRLSILNDAGPDAQHLEFQRDSPSLSEVRIQAFSNPAERLTLTWGKITEFISDNNKFEEEELRTLLKLMPNVTTLNIMGYNGRLNTENDIPLPKLRCLELSEDYLQVIHQLTTPRLKSLKIDCGWQSLEMAYNSSILPFLRRFKCHLETFVFNGTSIKDVWDEEEIRTITRVQGVQNSRVTNVRVTDDVTAEELISSGFL